jgi:putative membrane protein
MKVPFLCSAIFAMSVAMPMAAQADPPDQFLRKAITGDNSEMMLGRLAQSRAENPAVRSYGKTLESDHWDARSQVVAVARRMRLGTIANSRDIAPEARAEQNRLSGMRGRDFDREFIRYMIEDHRKDISDFREEAREGNDPAAMLARRQLPTLQKHLDIALSLQPEGQGRNADYRYRDRNDRDQGNDRGDNNDRNGYDRRGNDRNDNGRNDNSRNDNNPNGYNR